MAHGIKAFLVRATVDYPPGSSFVAQARPAETVVGASDPFEAIKLARIAFADAGHAAFMIRGSEPLPLVSAQAAQLTEAMIRCMRWG